MAHQERRLVKNAIRCNHCNAVVESKHRHDFRYCRCKKVAVDGGLDYTKRVYQSDPAVDYTELAEYVNEPPPTKAP